MKLWLAGLILALTAFPQSAKFTYPSGPTGCTQREGYMDPAHCATPGALPLGVFTVPAVGKSFTDAVFGGTVRVVTNRGFVHTYALPGPMSAKNRYLHIRSLVGNGYVLDLAKKKLDPSDGPYSLLWDAVNDNVGYFFSGTAIMRYSASKNSASKLIDYASYNPRFTGLENGGSTDISKDNWLAFWAPHERRVCALDLSSVKTYCAGLDDPKVVSRVGWGEIDYVLISKGVDKDTNKRYVLIMAGPALGVWSVNEKTGVLDFEFRGPENPDIKRGNGNGICDPGENCLAAPHADTLEVDGKQYLVAFKGTEEPCEVQLITMEIAKGLKVWTKVEKGGGRKAVMTMAKCGDLPWPGEHIGCAKSAPFCAISTHGPVRNPADNTSAVDPGPHSDEIMVMRGNGLEVRRLAKSRSVLFGQEAYWPQPRAALSNDGAFVIFDSNYGAQHNAVRVNIIPTGFGDAR